MKETFNSSVYKYFALVLLCTYISVVECKIIKASGEWTHDLDLENDGVSIKWRHFLEHDNATTGWIIMQVSARTKGYVGVGWSPHGGMEGADIVIGWVDSSGAAHLKDLHALANENPILDAKQDYELLNASEDENGTTIVFKRRWETCDEQYDMSIVNDSMRLIWAHSPFDPVDNEVSNLQWHGTKSRGAVTVYMVDDTLAMPFPDDNDPNVNTWDMVMKDNLVDAEHTTYFCKIVKLPPLDGKRQMIGYKPIITPGNEKNVHHIVFYECMIPPEYGNTAAVFEKHLSNAGGRCYTQNMPPEWSKHCTTFLFVWVAGSKGEMLPKHVGSPLGEEHGGSTYFMLEIHYDNPELKTFTDSSGVRIYYTEKDKLRPNDGSVLLLGYRITPFLLLPPKQENVVTYGICSSECTSKALPKEGINIIITLVHAHLSGKKIRVKHFRRGKELPLIAQENNYDFNYQQSRPLKKEIKILPGDELAVECEYDTRDSNRVILGGLSTKQEMCQTFLMYYPRIDLMQCTSQSEFHHFFKALGIDHVSGSVLQSIKMPYNPNLLSPEDQAFDPPDNAKELEESGDGASFTSVFDHITIEGPTKWKNTTVGKYLKMVNWTASVGNKNTFGKKVESKWKNGKHYAFCTGHGRKRVPLKNHIISYPHVSEPLEHTKSVCIANEAGVTSGAALQCVHAQLLFIVFVIPFRLFIH